jgi:hypothetical protein
MKLLLVVTTVAVVAVVVSVGLLTEAMTLSEVWVGPNGHPLFERAPDLRLLAYVLSLMGGACAGAWAGSKLA